MCINYREHIFFFNFKPQKFCYYKSYQKDFVDKRSSEFYINLLAKFLENSRVSTIFAIETFFRPRQFDYLQKNLDTYF